VTFKGNIAQFVTIFRFNQYEMHFEWKLKLKKHDTSYNLIWRVNKAGLAIVAMYF
jgi:hypothetical protein